MYSGVPETILPAQFFTGTAQASTPERRLILAVLWDAIVQLRGSEADAIEAERWIRNEVEDVPLSFPAVCEALGFEPRGLGLVLLDWRMHAVLGVRLRPIPSSRYTVSPRRDGGPRH